MQPLGLKGTPALGKRLLRLLLLLSLLQWRVTHAQTTPGTPGAPTTPGAPNSWAMAATASSPTTPATSSTPRMRERARALMRAFPLVDGCVWGGGRMETEPKAGEEVLSMQG